MRVVKCALCGYKLGPKARESVIAVGCTSADCLLSLLAIEDMLATFEGDNAGALAKLAEALTRQEGD